MPARDPPDRDKWRTAGKARNNNEKNDAKPNDTIAKGRPVIKKNPTNAKSSQNSPTSPDQDAKTKNSQASGNFKRKEMSPQEKSQLLNKNKQQRLTYVTDSGVTDSGADSQGISHEEMRDMWETLSPGQKSNKKISHLVKMFGGASQPQGLAQGPSTSRHTGNELLSQEEGTNPPQQKDPQNTEEDATPHEEEAEDEPRGNPEELRDNPEEPSGIPEEPSDNTEEPSEECTVIMEFRTQDKNIIKCPDDLEDALQPVISGITTLINIKPNFPRGVLAFILKSEQDARKLLSVESLQIDGTILPVTCRWT